MINNPLIQSIVAGLIISSASFVGLLVTASSFGVYLKKYLLYLVSFSAGVFLFTSTNLLGEALELSSPLVVGGGVLLGLLTFFFLEVFLPESHHHHSSDCDHSHKNKKGATRMLIGDTIHNIGDGIILAPLFAVNLYLGVIATVSILIHEVLQEVSEYIVLVHAGYTPREAVLRNVVTSLSIIPGVFLGWYLSETSFLQAGLLAFSSGAFLYIVLHDLIPHTFSPEHKKDTRLYILSFALGFLLLFVLSQILPHIHAV